MANAVKADVAKEQTFHWPPSLTFVHSGLALLLACLEPLVLVGVLAPPGGFKGEYRSV